jgi:cellulose synthase (UDP-forming)
MSIIPFFATPTVQRPAAHKAGPLTATARQAPTGKLPSAPTDTEKFAYFGSQHRWFIWLRTVATISACVSLGLFSNGMVVLWLFWIPLTIGLMYLVVMHYASTRRRQFSKVDHLRITEMWSPGSYPSVDVFLPSAGEDLDVLDNTYRHVAALKYPGEVSVHVLDDADRDDVRELARFYGFEHHVRANRPHLKKAGNLKHGFDVSTGDVILILDADFCPRTDLLTELMPYLDDPTIGIVQSPQYFDADRSMHWLQRGAAAVQESFYRWAQVSRDRLGAPICVGTCALYRRAALDAIDGFPQIGHSEDIHTGVDMMKVGFRTIYIPVVLAKGLCPDKMASYISQQYRWCQGSMSLLRDQRFHDAPFTYAQRMSFFAGFGYYISTAIGVVCLPLPTLIMLWWMPERVQVENFLWMVPALLMIPVVSVMHHTGWRLGDLRLYTISSFTHVAAIVDTVRGRAAEWRPTGETHRTSMTSRVVTGMLGWVLLTNLATLAGAVHFLRTGRNPIDVLPILVATCFFVLIWGPIARLAWDERDVRRENVADDGLMVQAQA